MNTELDTASMVNIPELRIVKVSSNLDYLEKISSPKDAVKMMKYIIGDYCNYKEMFIALYLNRRNKIEGYSVVGLGTQTGCTVDIPDICRLALLSTAKSVIVAHNHPSGDVKPSKEDKKVSRKIKDALNVFEIDLLDSIIIRDEDSHYYSLSDEMEL